MKIIPQSLKPHLPFVTYLLELVIFWRLVLFLGLGLGMLLIPQIHPSFPYAHARLIFTHSPLIWPWGNFDGVHYLQIIINGYKDAYTQALFPFFPLISRIISSTIHVNPLSSGLIISHVSLFFALFFLVKLTTNHLQLKAILVPRLLWYLILFPTSFFFGALYTESLFLLLSVLCFYFAYRQNWWLTGLAGALATATRFTGIFLFPSVLIIWWHNYSSLPDRVQGRTLHQLSKTLSIFKSSLSSLSSVFRQSFPLQLLLIPLGLLIYMLYLHLTTGDPLFFIHAQPHFSTHRTVSQFILLPQVFWRYVKMLTTVSPLTPTYFSLSLEFLTAVIFGFLSLFTFKRFGLALGFYTFASYLLPTFTGSFSSLPRYVLVLFPCFIILTELADKHPLVKWLYLTLSPILLIISIILFTRGLWVA